MPTPRTLRAWYGIVEFNVPFDSPRVTLSRVPDKDQGQGQQHMRFAGELLLMPSVLGPFMDVMRGESLAIFEGGPTRDSVAVAL